MRGECSALPDKQLFTESNTCIQRRYVYKCKKPRFRHELTANDTCKTAKKLQKGDITQQHIDT